MKKAVNSTLGKILIIVIVVIAAFGVRSVLEEEEQNRQAEGKEERGSQRRVEYAQPVEENNKILKVLKKKLPDAEILIACEEDVTNDGYKDLVAIYRQKDLTRTIVVIDSGDGENYDFSTPIPGPIENQKIQFKNIDKEAEMEIIITGEKKGAVGYAIYRMIDGEPVDLFGEGMEDCC